MKAKVIRDIASEYLEDPISSLVGEEVEIVATIPARTNILMGTENGSCTSMTNKVTYLTKGGSSRTRLKAETGHPVGEPVTALFVAIVGGIVYQGSDLYAAEELEILPCE